MNAVAAGPFPLINARILPGQAENFVAGIEDADAHAIAQAELDYFRGNAEEASRGVEPYLLSSDLALRVPANLLCGYANLSLGRTATAHKCLKRLIDEASPDTSSGNILPAFGACMASTLLHLPAYRVDDLSAIFHYLPEGLRLYACYVLAHRNYLNGDYQQSLGIIHGARSMASYPYVISNVYLGIMESIDLIALKKIDEAKAAFMRTRELALPDGLIEGFGEHHGILGGLIEACLKRDYPSDYKRVIDITYRFSSGWRRLHGPIADEDVADNLTTTEFSVAMLVKRGWTNNEVARLLGVSENTVKYHLSHVYEKLHINSRKELGQYMLR
jgi:DNA-binding CsgD family transcriptional regulator